MLVESGDTIIGYKDNENIVGQYAIALDHTSSYPSTATHAYNLDINKESSGEAIYARFVKANYDRPPRYIIVNHNYLRHKIRMPQKIFEEEK